MLNLIQKLKSSGNPFIDQIRGIPPEALRKQDIQPISNQNISEIDLMNEIKTLINGGHSFENISQAIDSTPEIINKENALSIAKNLYDKIPHKISQSLNP